MEPLWCLFLVYMVWVSNVWWVSLWNSVFVKIRISHQTQNKLFNIENRATTTRIRCLEKVPRVLQYRRESLSFTSDWRHQGKHRPSRSWSWIPLQTWSPRDGRRPFWWPEHPPDYRLGQTWAGTLTDPQSVIKKQKPWQITRYLTKLAQWLSFCWYTSCCFIRFISWGLIVFVVTGWCWHAILTRLDWLTGRGVFLGRWDKTGPHGLVPPPPVTAGLLSVKSFHEKKSQTGTEFKYWHLLHILHQS